MKVYLIVTGFEYEGFDRPEACFSSQEKAMAYLKDLCLKQKGIMDDTGLLFKTNWDADVTEIYEIDVQ